MEADTDELVTKAEARTILRVSPASFDRLVASGKLKRPVRILSNRSHFPRSEITAFQSMLVEGRDVLAANPSVITELAKLESTEYSRIKADRATQLGCSVRALDHVVEQPRREVERHHRKEVA